MGKHYVTHLPFRSWCPICNAAKLKEDPHYRVSAEGQEDRQSGLPIISMDYQEFDKVWSDKNEDSETAAQPKVKTIVVKDERTTHVLSYKVTKKGASDAWAIKILVKDFSEWGRKGIILNTRGDQR